MRATMMQRHPDMLAGKVVHLPNGIDLEQIPDDCVEKYGPLTITYAGTLYFDRTPEPLFQAFGELMSEGSAQAGDFRIKLVGNCRSIGGADTMEVARRYGIESAVEFSGRVPRAEAIRIMRRSHLLLVLAPPNHDLVLPAKIFDYLGSGSKLLALAGHGATADLMRETGAGMCVAPNDVPALKRYLGDLLKSGRYRCLRNEPASFARYDVRASAGQLAAELSRAMRGDGLPLRT
jgi:glycosyltransferase involved in cell wall biosynthesis